MKNLLDKLFRKLYQSISCILITIYYEYYLLLHAYQMLENPIKTGRRSAFEEPNTFKFQFDLERTDTFQRVLMNSLVLRG